MRAAGVLFAAWLGLAAAPGPVRACGHCHEDKVAAVYDHAVLEQARSSRQRVVYLEWKRLPPRAPLAPARVRALVGGTPGVLARTVRVSPAPAAVAFAYDPRRQDEAKLVQAVNRRLVPLGAVLVRLESRP